MGSTLRVVPAMSQLVPPNPCEACIRAAWRTSSYFRSGCMGCAARAVGRGKNFRESRDSGMRTWAYRRELEQFGVTHDAVKLAHAVDFEEHRTSAAA